MLSNFYRRELVPGLLVFLFLAFNTIQADDQSKERVSMGSIQLDFWLDELGRPSYSVSYGDRPVVLESHLGMVLKEDSSLYRDFEITGRESRTADETWLPVWGEKKSIRNHYKELTVHLHQKSAPGA